MTKIKELFVIRLWLNHLKRYIINELNNPEFFKGLKNGNEGKAEIVKNTYG